MADIVMFPKDDRELKSPQTDMSNDTFLLDEGLDMLAAYRLIRDASVRASLRQLAKTLAESSPSTPST
jgi:hypothetical protein